MSNKREAIPIAKQIVQKVMKDESLLLGVIEAITAKNEAIRYPNAIALEELIKKIPEKIYPQFDYFIELTRSKNAFHRVIGLSTIAGLTKVDKENKFDLHFDLIFNMMDDSSIMVVRNLVFVSNEIINNKPYLLGKVTEKLLKIDETHHDPKRSALIWGDIIEVLGNHFENSKEKGEIINFARKQLKSTSPSTVKKAKEFLNKYVM